MVLYPNKLPESERVCFGICIQMAAIKDSIANSLFKEANEIKKKINQK